MKKLLKKMFTYKTESKKQDSKRKNLKDEYELLAEQIIKVKKCINKGELKAAKQVLGLEETASKTRIKNEIVHLFDLLKDLEKKEFLSLKNNYLNKVKQDPKLTEKEIQTEEERLNRMTVKGLEWEFGVKIFAQEESPWSILPLEEAKTIVNKNNQFSKIRSEMKQVDYLSEQTKKEGLNGLNRRYKYLMKTQNDNTQRKKVPKPKLRSSI